MLDAGYSPERVVRVLATNALRPMRMLRPGEPEKTSNDQV
jgi:hypothetical protein